jgi:hypothetical protein
MKQSEDLQYGDSAPRSRAGASLAVGAAVAAVGAAYLFALSQSGLLRSSTAWWSEPSAARGPSWVLPAIAAGVAVGGISLGVVLLSWLTRSVAQHPYRWLGPVLVGFAMLVLNGMHMALPWVSVPYPLFMALSGFALLSGGAVMQSSGWPARLAGGFVLSLPLLALMVGFAATPGGVNAAMQAEGAPLVWLVLALTAVGVGLAALVGRSDSEYHVAQLRRRLKDKELQLVDAIEVGRWNQARLAAAEQRAQLAEHGVYNGGGYDADAAAFAAAAQPRSLTPWLMAGLGMIGVGIAAGTYLGLYRPLLKHASAQQALMNESVQSHSAELEQLRARFDAKQQSLQAELSAARTQVPAHPAAAEPTKSAKPAIAAPAAAAVAAAQPSPAPKLETKTQIEPATSAAVARSNSKALAAAKAKRAANRRAKHAAAAAAAAPPSAKAKAATKAAAAPTSEADDLDRKMQRALRENENADDDPIGGLE